MLQADDVALVLGDDLRHAHQLAGAVGQKHAHREDAVALNKAVLHHRRHGDDVHVAAGKDGDDLLAREIQMAQRRHGEQAGILDDHLVAFDHVQKRHDQLGVVDGDDVVEVLLQIREGLVAGLEHRGAVGDGARVRQLHHMPGLDGRLHAGRALRLHADHLDVRVQQLGQGGHAGGKPAAADGHQDVVHQRQLLDDLHGDGALAGGDAQVVERVDERVAVFLGQLHGVLIGLVVNVAVQNHLGAEVLRALDLDERRGGGHDDGGLHAVALGGVGDALRMVAGRRRDEPA